MSFSEPFVCSGISGWSSVAVALRQSQQMTMEKIDGEDGWTIAEIGAAPGWVITPAHMRMWWSPPRLTTRPHHPGEERLNLGRRLLAVVDPRPAPSLRRRGGLHDRRDGDCSSHLDVHLIADNYATHKHAKVQAWLKRHRRFHMHFTPTSASWINQVERFFGLSRLVWLSVVVRRYSSNRTMYQPAPAPRDTCSGQAGPGVS
jgi:DDE superfamily endonuclease